MLNLDGSVARQGDLLAVGRWTAVDLTCIGPAARLWADSRQASAISSALRPEHRNWITFIGSGDYHYVSSLLLRQYEEPLTVVAFDHHPDWEVLPPRYGCGAWVSRAIEQPNVHEVVLAGNASDDLEFPAIMTANLAGVRSGRIIPLPWQAPPPGRWSRGGVRWRELWKDPIGVLSAVMSELPKRDVYISVDKDCLRSDHALTNWEEGRLSLDTLLASLRWLAENRNIVGMDVTGEYSAGPIPQLIKALCSRWDHPKDYTAKGRSKDEIDRINGGTNLRIIETMLRP